ncbi:nucleolar GTP-binding protein [Phialemonium atrogriseum]|uniref:Nucleolar GTP-binding protein 2 n=1 Tax=Phialemonium atrogriseum TaxID=1093897 RepID=A0AAJ0BZD9_9PEZI|nr:nucleolar GTP-binding protein [Phialemonium atrogriseum]KAK1767056.1 nucleolar GTP-binding protein [Phialemonium atrogriseum]
MGNAKKEKTRVARQGNAGDGMANVKVKGENFYRSAKQVKTMNILKEGKPIRNSKGKIVQAASYQSRDLPTAVIEPNRRWFQNTRVISQDTLKSFREAMAEKDKDPYQVLLKSNKLPMSLIRDGQETNGLKQHEAKITIESSPFAEVFGPKASRKRVKLNVSSIADLADDAGKSLERYHDRQEELKLLSGNSGVDADGTEAAPAEEDFSISLAKEPIFSKGQSKRIWNELYKVIDSSDVILHVLDARDPLGTRCRSVEKYLREEAPHKHMVFVLNKTDLVPTSVAANWVRTLRKEYPTCAFKANVQNSFGKGSVIQLLKQFSILHKDRKQISVGLVGYPNVGKSSIINTLRGKVVCPTAPIPGETKVWRYVTLIKRIYLIDAPGIVPPNQQDTPEDILLRGVVRVENVSNPEQYIPAVLKKCKRHHVERTYELTDWETHIQFLELLARKGGRLLKGGEPDLDAVAKMVLNDFMRGKIPWFTPPPPVIEGDEAEAPSDRTGRLGEMPRKRKREETGSVSGTSMGVPTTVNEEDEESSDDDDFEGFESDSESDAPVEGVDKAASEKKGAEDMIPLDLTSDEEADEDDPSSDDASDDGKGTSTVGGVASGVSEEDGEDNEDQRKISPNTKRRKAGR